MQLFLIVLNRETKLNVFNQLSTKSVSRHNDFDMPLCLLTHWNTSNVRKIIVINVTSNYIL